MKINIKYYASLREKAGKSQEDLNLSTLMSPSDIYEMLSKEHGFSLGPKEIKYSVNNEYVPADSLLKENDVLVFIPPVAGG